MHIELPLTHRICVKTSRKTYIRLMHYIVKYLRITIRCSIKPLPNNVTQRIKLRFPSVVSDNTISAKKSSCNCYRIAIYREYENN